MIHPYRLMNLSKYLTLLAFCLCCGLPVDASDDNRPAQQFKFVADTLDKLADDGDEFSIIHQLLARGAYISAADMLESLYEQNPSDRIVINLLLVCYTELKAFPKAEMLLQRQLEQNPNDYQFQFGLLEVYLKTGTDSLITRQIQIILERFPGDRDVYQAVIQVLIRDGYAEKGMDIIYRARKEFDDENLFVLQAASLLETRQAYYDAIMEYFRAIQGDSITAAEADKRTATLIRYPLAPRDAIRAFQSILDSLPDNLYALRFLSESYILDGQYAEAFDAVIRIDSVEGQGGKELLGYLRRCRDRKLYDQVINVADYFERMYPESNILISYKIYRAEALRGMGRPYEAIDYYTFIADSSINRRDHFESLMEIGNIYRYDLLDYDSARIFYDSVVSYCPYDRIVYLVNLEKARLFLVDGNLEDAESTFTWINRDRLRPEQVEYIDYNLAMIDFLRKDFEKADTKFRRLIQTYPRGFYLNDAMINSLIIGESFLGESDMLSDYAESQLFQYRLMPDSVEQRLKTIIARGQSPLAGITFYKLATLYSDIGADSSALALIDSMERELSDDYFFPYCLKLRGDILSRDENTRDRSIEIYRLILTDFDNYPFVGEIRKKLQELEGYRPAG